MPTNNPYMFMISSQGLEVHFKRILPIPPALTRFNWDFGDGQTSVEQYPTHIYSSEGIYPVVMKVITPTDEFVYTKEVMVSEDTKTQLSGSIYELIDTYVPSSIVSSFPYATKQVYIEKWQLYLQPLVNHEVNIEEYNNELKYEALENQLIMELAVYDFLVNTFTNLLQSVSSSHTIRDEEIVIENRSDVKKIVTGPSQVEFFDSGTTDTEIMSSATKAVQPGGIMDILHRNLCTLAERLEIYIPYCTNPAHRMIPLVEHTKRPTRPLRGPNPKYPLE